MSARIVRLSLVFLGFGAAFGSTWVVPRAAEITAASGAHYSTDLKILNRGTDAASVVLQFIPSSGTAAPAPVSESIAAGQTLVLTDVLNSLWGLSETFGGVQISSDHVLLVNARTYNSANPPGTYGYLEEAAALTDLPNGGQSRHAIWVSQSVDSTKGFSTIAGAVLLTPDAAIAVTLLDPANNIIGSATFSGLGAHEVALATLAKTDLPVGRLEFDVASGLAAPYAVVIDNVTGDVMSVPPAQQTSTATDVVFPNLVKAVTSQTQTWRSDLRLISSATAAIAVQATVVSSSALALIGSKQSITLNPGRVTEMQDVLGVVFQAPDGTTATVELQSPSAVLILARTAYVYSGGAPGSFGYLQTGNPAAGYLAPGETATLIGLKQDTQPPGAISTIGAAAGADGFTADLTLSDSSGNVLATIPSGLSVSPSTTSEVPIGMLFPNVTIPDDARLDIVPDSGEAAVYAKNADLTTNDINQAVASIPQPYYCPAPAVISLSATPAALAAAGPVELDWNASGATSVQIDQGVGAGGGSGSATVKLAASTTFNLTAQNGCGKATASVTVPIGAPALSAITPPNPMPGQAATLSMRNVANITTARSAQLTCGTAAPQTVLLDTGNSGNVTFVVPLVADTTFPAGYWNGVCTLTALVDNGQTAPLSFTIAPLVYSGDPVAAFKILVANIQQEAHAKFAAQTGTDAFGKVSAALNPLVDQWAAQLNQMASGISANGTASLPLDVSVPTAMNPPTATIARADLTTFVALINASAPGLFTPLQTSSLSPLRRRDAATPPGYHDDGSSSCLIRDPQVITFSGTLSGSTTWGNTYAQCLQPAYPFQKILDTVIPQLAKSVLTVQRINSPTGLSLMNCIVPELTDIPAITNLVLALTRLANSAAILCNLVPTTFVSFEAHQTPPQAIIPVGVLEQTNNSGTHLFVNLADNFDLTQQTSVQQGLGNLLAASFVKALNSLATQSGCSPAVNSQIQALGLPLSAAETYLAGNFIHDYASAFPILVQKEVYKCDLSAVDPHDPSALTERPDRENPVTPPYWFEGHEIGPTELDIFPYPGNFILPTEVAALVAPPVAVNAPPAQLNDFENNSHATVKVDNGPTLAVTQQDATAFYSQDPETESPATDCIPQLVIASVFSATAGVTPPPACDPSHGAPTAYRPYTGLNPVNTKVGDAPANVTVTPSVSGNNKYTVVVNAGGLKPGGSQPYLGKAVIELAATNPSPFGGKSYVKIDGKLGIAPIVYSPTTAAGPNGQILITDSLGKTTTISLYPGDNAMNPFTIMADSSCSGATGATTDCPHPGPVTVYVGLACATAITPSTINFSVTLDIEFLNGVRPADQIDSPP